MSGNRIGVSCVNVIFEDIEYVIFFLNKELFYRRPQVYYLCSCVRLNKCCLINLYYSQQFWVFELMAISIRGPVIIGGWNGVSLGILSIFP